MTLKEWSDRFGILPTHPTTGQGATSVLATVATDPFRALYSLEDYKVSSVCGAVVWLVPNPNIIRVGDRVAYRVTFLRSICAYTGELPFARGKVTDITGDIATIDWNNGAPPRVHTANLIGADRLHLEID
jgi:hypothetical protein